MWGLPWRVMIVVGCVLALMPVGPATASGRRPAGAASQPCFRVAASPVQPLPKGISHARAMIPAIRAC